MTYKELTCIEGEARANGDCLLRWNLDYNKIYSPDGRQQLLPCLGCGQPQWVGTRTVSVLCNTCAEARCALCGEPAEVGSPYCRCCQDLGVEL